MKKLLLLFFVLCLSMANCACKKNQVIENCETLGHNYEEQKQREETCTQNGLILMKCSRCSDGYEMEVPAKGHENKLQDNGEDICQICGIKSYTTNSVNTLCVLLASLKDPQSAEIISIYAGNYTYDNVKYVAVVTTLRAKNSFGAMVSGEYLSLHNLQDNTLILDAVSYAQKLANKYDMEADHAFGASKLEALHKVTESLEMKTEFLGVIAYKSKWLKIQDLDYIVKESERLMET